MHGASRADLHCRRPPPAQRLHDSLDRCFVDTSSRVALSPLPRARAFVNCCAVHEIVDLLVWKACCDCYRSHNAVTGLPFVSSSRASAVIESKMRGHAYVDSFLKIFE